MTDCGSKVSSAEAKCRMCGDEPDERTACPECGGCFACSSDDCGVCCERLDYMKTETARRDTPSHRDRVAHR